MLKPTYKLRFYIGGELIYLLNTNCDRRVKSMLEWFQGIIHGDCYQIGLDHKLVSPFNLDVEWV